MILQLLLSLDRSVLHVRRPPASSQGVQTGSLQAHRLRKVLAFCHRHPSLLLVLSLCSSMNKMISTLDPVSLRLLERRARGRNMVAFLQVGHSPAPGTMLLSRARIWTSSRVRSRTCSHLKNAPGATLARTRRRPPVFQARVWHPHAKVVGVRVHIQTQTRSIIGTRALSRHPRC